MKCISIHFFLFQFKQVKIPIDPFIWIELWETSVFSSSILFSRLSLTLLVTDRVNKWDTNEREGMKTDGHLRDKTHSLSWQCISYREERYHNSRFSLHFIFLYSSHSVCQWSWRENPLTSLWCLWRKHCLMSCECKRHGAFMSGGNKTGMSFSNNRQENDFSSSKARKKERDVTERKRTGTTRERERERGRGNGGKENRTRKTDSKSSDRNTSLIYCHFKGRVSFIHSVCRL